MISAVSVIQGIEGRMFKLLMKCLSFYSAKAESCDHCGLSVILSSITHERVNGC